MKTSNRNIHLLGYAAAVGGVNKECGHGPLHLRASKDLQVLAGQLSQAGIKLDWELMLLPNDQSAKQAEIERLCQLLARNTVALTRLKEFFIVFGGDHTAAIGTWSGVHEALAGPLGLIWIDAHMDSHTPETSVSGRFHGMPLACLLGEGVAPLTQLQSSAVKIKPEHLCLIGVRSYEPEEAALLERLKVRVYFMDEVKKRGLPAIFKEAVERVATATAGYGLSLDIDSVDPLEAPGVDVPEPDGLKAKDLCAVLSGVARDPRLLGVEIVEFNPDRDVDQKTEKVIIEVVRAILA